MATNLTLNVPIVLNVINRDLEYISSKLVFIPYGTSEQVKKILSADHSSWSKDDKLKLRTQYGMDIVSSTVYGGGIDEGVPDPDELHEIFGGDEVLYDDLDEDSLLVDDMTLTFDEEDIRNITEVSSSDIHTSTPINKSTPSDTTSYTPTKTRLNIGVNVASTMLFSSDTIQTFKQKVFVETGIPPYRQHIWFVFSGKSYQLSYRVKHDTYQSVDIADIKYIETVLEDIPVDSMWYASKEIIHVESNEHITVNHITTKYQITEFNIIDINSFINQKNHESVRRIVMLDSYAYELIYWGFIVKYFPMMSMIIFKEYLRDPLTIKTNYPLLHPSRKLLIEQFIMEQTLLLQSVPKYDEKIIKINIINSTVSVKSRYSNIDDNVVLRNLFDMFQLNDFINNAVCNTQLDTHRITLIKKYKDISVEYSHVPSNTIQYNIQIPKYGNVQLQINKLGNYKVIGEWIDGSELMFDTIFKVLDENIMPIISSINDFKSIVTTRPLEPISITNSIFSNINMFLYIKKKITTAKFVELRKYLAKFTSAGILERVDADNNILHYYQLKGVFMYDMNKYRLNAPLQNEYSVLFDASAKSKWSMFITKKKSIKFIRRFSDIKIEVDGIREEEYNIWYTFLQLMLIPILNIQEEDIKVTTSADTLEFKSNMKIRHLKEMDPVLYDLKKMYGKKIVYSQICQRPHQPRIHDSAGVNRTKYWNFTTNEPMWYSCPDPKFPHLYFKIGVHPLQYCMPCCKKKEISVDSNETQSKVFNECIEKHTYTREKKLATRSRYVKTYSRFLHPGRISRLPEETLEPLMYDNFSVQNRGIDEECAKDHGYYIFGVAQHGQSISNIGFLYCIMSALDITMAELVTQTLKYIENSENWTFLLSGKIVHHFSSKKDLMYTIKMSLLQNQISSFTSWNELFIEIVRLYWDINVVIFVDHGTESTNSTTITHDSNIHLFIHENIQYLHDYFIHKRSIIVINRNMTYYPIYMLYIHMYFKSGIVDKKIYEHGDKVINIISQIVQDYLNKVVVSKSSIDLHMIKYFVQHNADVEIDTLFISDTNLCYGICLTVSENSSGHKPNKNKNIVKDKNKSQKVYIPIQHSMYSTSHKITFDIMSPAHNNDWPLLKLIIGRINQSIAEYSEGKGRILSDDISIPLMQRVNPIYPYLQYNDWVIYKGKVFGVLSQFLLFYVTPSTIIKEDIKHQIEYIIEPHVVNKVIQMHLPPIDDRKSELINNALYNQYLYQLLFLTFIDIVHTHRNTPIRTQIKKIIQANAVLNGVTKLSTNVVDELRKVLFEYPHDLQIVVKMMMYADAENVLDNSFLEFDKYIITELIQLPVPECKEQVKKILSKFVIEGLPEWKEDIPNMLSSCITSDKTTSPYCKSKKLIIPSDKLNAYIDILVMDIKNPLKAKYLTLYTFIPRSIDYFNFINRPNEKIYITM